MRMLERHYDMLMKGIPAGTDVPAIDVTEAARWFLDESDKEYWDYSKDFPSVVPPFMFTWLEFVPPKTIYTNGNHIDILKGIGAMGCMAQAYLVKDGMGQEVIRDDAMADLIMNRFGMTINRNEEERKCRIKNALLSGQVAKWLAIYNVGFEYKDRLFGNGAFCAYLDSEGRIIPNLQQLAVDNSHIGVGGGSYVLPFLFSLSLMHAKNTSLEDRPLPIPIAKKRAKRGLPTLQFKTLVVYPMRQVARSQVANGESSTKRAMHLCRGHFKDFRNGGGLFGKYRGLYWWDMHVRGDKAYGQVVKDYSVIPSNE